MTATKTKTKQHVLYVTIYKNEVVGTKNPQVHREFVSAYYPTLKVNIKSGKIIIYYRDHQDKLRQTSYYASQYDAEIRRETY